MSVAGTYPTKTLCLICKRKHPVIGGDDHGTIEEHDIVETQVDVREEYTCVVTQRCPGSGARVSKWAAINRGWSRT